MPSNRVADSGESAEKPPPRRGQTPYDSLECEHNRRRGEKMFEQIYKASAGAAPPISIQVAHGVTTWDADVTRYMEQNAILSAVNDKTLQFTCDKLKRKVWEEAKITRLLITFEEKPTKREQEEVMDTSLCHVSLDGDMVIFKFFRPAVEDGDQLNLHDALEFGLHMQDVLTGKCYYRSGWVGNFNDTGASDAIPVKQWLQCRHHCIYFYPNRSEGWSWRGSAPPDDLPVAQDVSYSDAQKKEAARNRFYTLPGINTGMAEALPPLPNLPQDLVPGGDIAQYIPQAAAADAEPARVLSSGAKKRPSHPRAPYGRIQLAGARASHNGATLVLSNAEVLQFWDAGSGNTTHESQGKRRFVLECGSEEQAKSWVETLIFGGATRGSEGSGCCTVM